MNGTLQTQISPPVAQPGRQISAAATKSTDGVRNEEQLAEFRKLIMDSNSAVQRERIAKGSENNLASAKSSEEFFERLRAGADQNAPKPPTSEMDKDAFLKLFIAQLQNQDPLQPKDGSEMASQMAQFQSLESSMNINKTLENLVTSQSRNQAVSLVDFVGKEVNIKGGRLKITDGKLQDAMMNLSSDANSTTVEVRDGSGKVVATQELGTLGRGKHTLSFDGIGSDGKKLTDGVYTFAILAKDGRDGDIPVEISSSVKVTGVNLMDEGGSFYTDLGSVKVEEISSVGNAGYMSAELDKIEAEKAAAKQKSSETKAAQKNSLAPNMTDADPAVSETSPSEPGKDEKQAGTTAQASAPEPPPEIKEQAMKAAQNMMQNASKPAQPS